MKKKIDTNSAKLPGLFDKIEGQEGSLEQTALIKAAMSEAIRKSSYKRFDIAYRLSVLIGSPITEAMLNQLTSSKPEYQLKAAHVAAFCEAVGNFILIEDILKSLGRSILDPKDEPAIRLAKAIHKKREAEQEILKAQHELERPNCPSTVRQAHSSGRSVRG